MQPRQKWQFFQGLTQHWEAVNRPGLLNFEKSTFPSKAQDYQPHSV